MKSGSRRRTPSSPDTSTRHSISTPGTDGVWFTWGGGSRIPNGIDSDTADDWVRNDFDGEGLPGFSGSLGPQEAVNTPNGENHAYVPRAPVLNEVVIDHIGADDHEFIEIFGEAMADYSTHHIVVLDGSAAGNPGAIDFVAQPGLVNGGSSWTTGFLVPDSLQNQSQTILLVTGFTGLEGDDLDTDDDGVLDTTPWNAVDDAVAFDAGGAGDHSYAAPVLGAGFDGLPGAPGGASRATSGFDSDSVDDWVRNDFDGEGLDGFPRRPRTAGGLQHARARQSPSSRGLLRDRERRAIRHPSGRPCTRSSMTTSATTTAPM